jgi:DMSO/TMAO reductase YedYZ molybdopterin-dependent catalytic subunit
MNSPVNSNYDNLDRRKEEKRIKNEGRLPPGQSLTLKFPVLHYGDIPEFHPVTWNLHIWGQVKDSVRINWAEFIELPRTKVLMDIHCVTRWSKADTLWEGVSLKTLVDLGLIQMVPNVTHVMQHAEFGYTVNLPLEVVLQDNFLLATHMNGKPISVEHGFPLRGVVGAIPGQPELASPYFWKGAKWLRGLEFMKQDRRGFWEKAGYSNTADVWTEDRFA